MLRATVSLVTFVGAVGVSMHSLAGLSVEELAKLGLTGTELTPAGAIRAGNADGSIPEWRYEPLKAPAGYKPGMFHLDPFVGDTVLFTITAANYKEYADKLTSGQLKMFETFPNYKMNIYPSRRSAVYPEYDIKLRWKMRRVPKLSLTKKAMLPLKTPSYPGLSQFQRMATKR